MKLKLNPIINGANSIINSNKFHRKNFVRNASFISLPNNQDNSKNNISTTTNASVAKLNSPRNFNIFPIAKSPKQSIETYFNKNLSNCSSRTLLSPISPRIKRKKIKILEKADIIVKRRLKINKILIDDAKKNAKIKAIKMSKDISLKNYIIKLLVDKRSQIYEKEREMNNALKAFTNQYDIDNKMFNEYIEEVKRKQELDEDLISKIKIEKEKKEKILNEQIFELKRLEDYLEKKLKLLYGTHIYAAFVHKIFDIKFNYANMPGLNRIKNVEEIIDKIINIYDTIDKFQPLPSILKDEELFYQKYVQFEEKIIHHMEARDIIMKDIYKMNDYYKKELKLLDNNYKEYEKDLNYLKEDLFSIKKSMKNLKIRDTNNIENYIEYIVDLGKEIVEKVPKKNFKENINEYTTYCKDVLLSLEEKEVTINNYINEINLILNFGENDDKILLKKCIKDRKKVNKIVNQLRIKQKQEQLENEKNLRYIRRAQRIVVKERNASPVFPLIKHVHKIKKINIKKNDDEIECVYSVTDEEK